MRSDVTISAENTAELLVSAVPAMMSVIRNDMRARRPTELSVAQFRALIYLKNHPGASLSDIAEHLGLALSTASQLNDGLMKRMYVTRESALEDRRRATLLLTEQGKAMLEAVYDKVRERMSVRLAELSAEERQTLMMAMRLLLRLSRKTSE